MAIGVAMADNIEGPYVDAIGTPSYFRSFVQN